MNRIHPDKLAQSKWTAMAPVDGEKHFIVVDVVRDRRGHVQQAILQAVLTRRRQTHDWRALTDDTVWQTGWR